MEIIKKCLKCGQDLTSYTAYKTASPFFTSFGGYLPYCIECCGTLINHNSIAEMDKFCRWADWPFYANKYILILKAKRDAATTINLYYKQNIIQLYKEGYNSPIDWESVSKEYIAQKEKGTLLQYISPEQKQAKENLLRQFWGDGDAETGRYTLSQLEYLDNLYHDLERTQNLTTGAQADQAKKLARLSLAMDIAEENRELELYVKLMGAYEKLVKVADFTPKNSQSASSFESMGELVAFLEKTGFINKFYDGEQRDIVDKTIKSQQIFLRRIVSGESNLAEKVEQRLQRMNLLDRMEDGTTSEEEWSYDLDHDEDWIDNEDVDEYTDPDEEEDFDAGE